MTLKRLYELHDLEGAFSIGFIFDEDCRAESVPMYCSLVTEQVANGVAVRMAVLWSLVGSGGPVV